MEFPEVKRPTLDDWKTQPWYKVLCLYEIFLRQTEEKLKEIKISMSDIYDGSEIQNTLLELFDMFGIPTSISVPSSPRLGEGPCSEEE